MTIRAVVFDVFGTLAYLGERRYPFRALQALMQANGRPKQPTDAVRIMTNNVGLAGAATLLGSDLSLRDISPLELDLQAELESTRLFPESERVLRELRARGLRLGICSNLAAPYATPVRLLLPFALDAYTWSFEASVLKPNPEAYASVCSKLSCSPEDVLMIGDTPEADFYGPRAFGMQSLLLDRNLAGSQEYTLTDLADLPARLESYAG